MEASDILHRYKILRNSRHADKLIRIPNIKIKMNTDTIRNFNHGTKILYNNSLISDKMTLDNVG